MFRWQPLATILIAAFIAGCVPVKAVRTELPLSSADHSDSNALLPTPHLTAECITGSGRPGELSRVIEEYGSYTIGYAEFDDQGWSYLADAQLQAIQARLGRDLADPQYANDDFSVLVFIHGWHHNAHDNDCNVQEMRQMMRLSSSQLDTAYSEKKLKRRRHLFGIYVGWRGESVNAMGIRYATVIDRRNAADKVAKGSVRQLLANLHVQEIAAREAAAGDVAQHRTDSVDIADRMFTTVVGHSFGGLIAFNGLSQDLLDDLTIACSKDLSPTIRVLPDVWPDEVVLINPAFEASRFETLNRLAEKSTGCRGLRPNPLLTVITADNDPWTGWVFTLGRRFLTLFEPYDTSTAETRAREKDSNIRAIGFVSRYQTHRLCLQSDHGLERAIVYPKEMTRQSKEDANRQVWVVGSPKTIIDGHNGFLFVRSSNGPQPYLLQWLIAMHIPGSNVRGKKEQCGGAT